MFRRNALHLHIQLRDWILWVRISTLFQGSWYVHIPVVIVVNSSWPCYFPESLPSKLKTDFLWLPSIVLSFHKVILNKDIALTWQIFTCLESLFWIICSSSLIITWVFSHLCVCVCICMCVFVIMDFLIILGNHIRLLCHWAYG